MEKNRKRIVGAVSAMLVTVVAAAVLFGLTGVLRDPAAPLELAQATQSSTATSPQPATPTTAVSSTVDGGSAEVATAQPPADEPFPQFDDEPTGS